MRGAVGNKRGKDMYWSWVAQAALARKRGEYKIAVFMIGQARVLRIRSEKIYGRV